VADIMHLVAAETIAGLGLTDHRSLRTKHYFILNSRGEGALVESGSFAVIEFDRAGRHRVATFARPLIDTFFTDY
jgi:hypothetical protein